MKYNVEKTLSDRVVIAEIRLNDECKNGHQNFAITGRVYEKDKPRHDRYVIRGGCCHDDILKAFPEFKVFVDLHLSDYNGSPMYPESNGWYYCRREQFDVLQGMMRCNDEQLEVLKTAVDQKHFHYLLQTSGIVEMWKKEAGIGIAEMERLTGEKFVNTSTKSQFTPLSIEELADMTEKVNAGFYSTEASEKRATEAINEKNKSLISDLRTKRDAKIRNAEKKFNVESWVASESLPLDSFNYDCDCRGDGGILFNWIESIGTQIRMSKLRGVLSKEASAVFMKDNNLTPYINVNSIRYRYDFESGEFVEVKKK